MDPITAAIAVGAGTQIVGGIMNWQNSESARKANAKERAKMQGLIDKIGMPDFDTSMITPEEYKVLQKFSPEIAPYVEEQAPGVLKAASEGATQGREAQMAALDRLRNLSATGQDTQSKILQDQALSAAAAQSRGQQDAIQQSLQRRGMAGSGMGLVQALLAQQGSGSAAQQASQQAALNAYNTRLQALRDSASLGSQIRGQDIDLEAKNLDIMNDFNRRAADRRQAYLNAAADVRNKAQASNLDLAQQIANQNTAARNAARAANQDTRNQAASKMFDAQMSKAGQQSQLSQAAMNANTQAAMDRNQMITGLAGAAGSMAQGYGASKQADYASRMKDEELKAKYGDKYNSIY